eukprot:jgi/Botrbrau1/7044/Bobra.0165s0067.1
MAGRAGRRGLGSRGDRPHSLLGRCARGVGTPKNDNRPSHPTREPISPHLLHDPPPPAASRPAGGGHAEAELCGVPRQKAAPEALEAMEGAPPHLAASVPALAALLFGHHAGRTWEEYFRLSLRIERLTAELQESLMGSSQAQKQLRPGALRHLPEPAERHCGAGLHCEGRPPRAAGWAPARQPPGTHWPPPPPRQVRAGASTTLCVYTGPLQWMLRWRRGLKRQPHRLKTPQIWVSAASCCETGRKAGAGAREAPRRGDAAGSPYELRVADVAEIQSICKSTIKLMQPDAVLDPASPRALHLAVANLQKGCGGGREG